MQKLIRQASPAAPPGAAQQQQQRRPPAQPGAVSRRRLVELGLGAAAAAAAAGVVASLPAAAAAGGPARDLTPYERGFQLEYGLLEGRIRACPSDANPNCVSSSSRNQVGQGGIRK